MTVISLKENIAFFLDKFIYNINSNIIHNIRVKVFLHKI